MTATGHDLTAADTHTDAGINRADGSVVSASWLVPPRIVEPAEDEQHPPCLTCQIVEEGLQG